MEGWGPRGPRLVDSTEPGLGEIVRISTAPSGECGRQVSPQRPSEKSCLVQWEGVNAIPFIPNRRPHRVMQRESTPATWLTSSERSSGRSCPWNRRDQGVLWNWIFDRRSMPSSMWSALAANGRTCRRSIPITTASIITTANGARMAPGDGSTRRCASWWITPKPWLNSVMLSAPQVLSL